MYAETGLVLGLMVVVLVTALWLRLHVALALILTALAGVLASRQGEVLRHLVEGGFGYFYLLLILAAGLILIEVLRDAGALEVITEALASSLLPRPFWLLVVVTLALMVPGMVTGFGGVSVLTAGVFVAPLLFRAGISPVDAAAIIALASLHGMVAPPVNLPAMAIVDGINMPYAGFTPILSLLSFPLAFFGTFYLGGRILRGVRASERDVARVGLAEVRPEANPRPVRHGVFRSCLGIAFIALLFLLIRGFPEVIPDLSTPLVLLVGAGVTCLGGPRRVNFLEASLRALRGPGLRLMGVLMGVGMVVQAMTLSGVRGLLVVGSLSLPSGWLFITIALGLPLLGGLLTSLGTASVLGVPFSYTLVGQDMIVTVAALSLLASLAEFTLPTAISGVLAAHVTGETRYLLVWRRAALPLGVSVSAGVLTLLFASPLGRILGGA